jgi:hypothetical protein
MPAARPRKNGYAELLRMVRSPATCTSTPGPQSVCHLASKIANGSGGRGAEALATCATAARSIAGERRPGAVGRPPPYRPGHTEAGYGVAVSGKAQMANERHPRAETPRDLPTAELVRVQRRHLHAAVPVFPAVA